MQIPNSPDLRATGCRFEDLPDGILEAIIDNDDGTDDRYYQVTDPDAAASIGEDLLAVGTLGEWFRHSVVLEFDCWAPTYGEVTLDFGDDYADPDVTVRSIRCHRKIVRPH